MAIRIPQHDTRDTESVVNHPHNASATTLPSGNRSFVKSAFADMAAQDSSTTTSTPTTSSGGSSTSSDAAAALPTSFSTEQWNQVEDAITAAFHSVEGGNFTNSQIYNDVVQTLRGEGWGSGNLEAVQTALGAWAGDTSQQSDKVVKGKSNTATDIASWWGTAQKNLTGIFSSNAQSAAGSSSATPSNVSTLLDALQGLAGSSPSIPTDPNAVSGDSTPTVVPVSTTSNPGMMIAIVLFLVAGVAVWFYYKKHHAQ